MYIAAIRHKMIQLVSKVLTFTKIPFFCHSQQSFLLSHLLTYFGTPECIGPVFRSKSCYFETPQSHCVVSLSKTLYMLLSTDSTKEDC